MPPAKKPQPLAQRLKKVRFTDEHLEAHQSLAQEDGPAWRSAVLERDGFAEAAKNGATGLMAWLLENGTSPDARPADKGRVNSTPPALMQVLRSLTGDGLKEWVERLLAAGANASLQHPDPRLINPVISRVSLVTPLSWALETAPLPVAGLLLDAAADPQVRVSAVAFAMSKLFVTPGAPGYPDSVPEPARQQFVKELVLAGLDVNTKTFDGRTLLHVACELRSTDAARWLLSVGADPSAACDREWSVGWTRVQMPAGARPLDVLRAHPEADPHAVAIREALSAGGAAPTATERERPSFAGAADELLEALFPAEAIANAYRRLPKPGDAFSYLLGMSNALPPPERLAGLAHSHALAYLLYRPAFAPYLDPRDFQPGEAYNERSGRNEYPQLLARAAFTKDAWAALEEASILSYWPGNGEGIGDVLALAKSDGSGERVLIRVSPAAVTVLGRCGPLAGELVEAVRRQG